MSEKIYTIEEIKKMLEELLKDKPVYQVILFGSYAKQKATNNRYKFRVERICTIKANMPNRRKTTKRD